ncbi:15706_t:CDS:2 [Cetraspora pellucida]|uniref:15706_t:CDS:1 n=1 Tax=Cetraspora pellucida TaxID=1433469 RepID=A0A9N9C671_9GLOM|nr:15706_t:CDS:2 [Cetraspora pellucida]
MASNNKLFYLDVSIPFTIYDESLMPWADLSSIVGAINRTSSSAYIDKTSIFFIGGYYSVNSPSINKFDTATQQWSTPSISGSIPLSSNLKYAPCVSLGNKIYIYGGNASLSAMNKLNTSSLLWSILSYTITSSKTQGYSATLLNDSILYIGGTNQLAFNGWNCPNKTFNLMKEDISDVSLIALDILAFTWLVPNISNTGGPQQVLRWHSSTMIGAYVLIAFGYLFPTVDIRTTTSDIFLLDVSRVDNYRWVTSYEPDKTLQPIPSTLFTQPTTPQ